MTASTDTELDEKSSNGEYFEKTGQVRTYCVAYLLFVLIGHIYSVKPVSKAKVKALQCENNKSQASKKKYKKPKMNMSHVGINRFNSVDSHVPFDIYKIFTFICCSNQI